MLRLQRPLLLGLLCVLVLSWGTCPCALSRAFASEPTEQIDAPVRTPVGCPCCQKHAEEEAAQTKEPVKSGCPEECPCCARGGAGRDLPPVGPVLVIPAVPTDFDLWIPALPTSPWALPALERWHLEATGPPSAASLHGCPVGIVRLLN